MPGREDEGHCEFGVDFEVGESVEATLEKGRGLMRKPFFG